LQLDITALNDETGGKNQNIAELERKLQAATTPAEENIEAHCLASELHGGSQEKI